MPKLIIVYGVLDDQGDRFSISFPDAENLTGRGKTREEAIDNGTLLLKGWAAKHALYPRTARELGWDPAVRLALQLGMELVAVPL